MRVGGFLWATISICCCSCQVVHSLTCESSENLYLLEGKLVQMIPDKIYKMRLEACTSNVDVKNKTPIFDLHKDLMNVTEIKLQDINLPPLPDSSRLEKVTIVLGSPTKVWGSCSHLKWLKVVVTALSSMHKDWLSNCTELRYLSLNTENIQEVQLMLDSAPQLEIVDLYMEDISAIMHYPLFPSARGREQSIREVRLGISWGDWEDSPSWTEVTGALIWQLSRIPRLRLLSLFDFLSFDFCASGNFSSVEFKSLEWLSLGKTKTSRLCFKEFRAMPQLNYLDLKNTEVSELKFSELVSARAPQLLVEFEQFDKWQPKSVLNSLVFDKEDYLALTDGPKKGNITVSLADNRKIKIDCDCKNAWFAKAAREGLVTAPSVVCYDGVAPAQKSPELVECDKFTCWSCNCYRFWKDGTVKADCTGVKLYNFTADLLAMSNLTTLLAAETFVKIPTRLPDRLLYLDLSDNNIWKLDAEQVYALFSVKNRRIRLAGNPIVCSCENEYLLNALKENPGRVDDYNDIKCVGSNKSLELVDVSELCADRDHEAAVVKAVVSMSLLSAAFVVIAGVAFYYRRTIKIFCFARGWCLCCVQEDELDSNRIFDVFLSFCHSDEAFITQELLPVLDQEYKVCVHFRDWIPGNLIPTQISNSVELSKRTVVVVSKNFVKSVWGVLEFRTAHMSALQEGRIRVVAVVLDDVLEDVELQGELKGYLRTNTYLKWGDPWFWDKLRYALPHHPRAQEMQKTFHQPFNNAAYEQPLEVLDSEE